MEQFNNITEAVEAAEKFFQENFEHYDGVGIESREGNVIEFYSKADPGMDDTYTCIIED